MGKNKTVKILVAYHKKAPLIKNNVFIPIHVGRSIAKASSKDGVLSDNDLEWLKDNMIGDDTGDNISHLNRDFCELTALYWAWKNYDKLGNPDYIGLTHYRRTFRLPGMPKDIIYYSNEEIIKNIENYRCVVPEPFKIEDPTIHTFKAYQCLCQFSKNYFPEFYLNYGTFERDKKMLACNMFIMRKDDFFDYCEKIFKILFKVNKIDIHSKTYKDFAQIMCDLRKDNFKLVYTNNKELKYMQRMCGFIGEYLTTFFVMDLIKESPLSILFSKLVSYTNTNKMDKKYYLFNVIPVLGKKRISYKKSILYLFCAIPFLKIKEK